MAHVYLEFSLWDHCSIPSNVFWDNSAFINLQTGSQHSIPGACTPRCAEKPSVTGKGCREPQHQLVPDSTKEDGWGVHACRGRGCDCYSPAFLPSRACLIYLTFDPEGQTVLFCFTRTYPKSPSTACLIGGEFLICLHLCSFWHRWLLAASFLPAFVSKFIQMLFASFLIWKRLPGSWRGKGGSSTRLSFVLRGENDMPFIVQINDQISTSVQSNEINSS